MTVRDNHLNGNQAENTMSTSAGLIFFCGKKASGKSTLRKRSGRSSKCCPSGAGRFLECAVATCRLTTAYRVSGR